jgi:hypothetical protein
MAQAYDTSPFVSGNAIKRKKAINNAIDAKAIRHAKTSNPFSNHKSINLVANTAEVAWHAVVSDETRARARKGNNSAGTTQVTIPILNV